MKPISSLTMLLQGGLGNQMFQYCASKSYAKYNNLSLELMSIHPINLSQPLIRAFHLTDDIKHLNKISLMHRIGFKISLLKKANFDLPKYFGIITENDFDFHRQLESNIPRKYITSDLYQSEIFFKGLDAHEIINMFQFKILNINDVDSLIQKIKSKNTLSIHLRRGDYLSEQNKSIHPCLPISYYCRAIDLASKISPIDHILIFTDSPKHIDITILLNHLQNYEHTLVSDYALEAHEELYLMSFCKTHIIANSTFSWWGAYLSSLTQKTTVFAPLNWYTRTKLETIDHTKIYPQSWIVLPS